LQRSRLIWEGGCWRIGCRIPDYTRIVEMRLRLRYSHLLVYILRISIVLRHKVQDQINVGMKPDGST
jgi:hypothetical protein